MDLKRCVVISPRYQRIGSENLKFEKFDPGLDLAVVGTLISCCGVFANNILLSHVLAMQFWMFSNPILLIWSFGLYRHWWTDGLSGLALTAMYTIFTVTNFIGLGLI